VLFVGREKREKRGRGEQMDLGLDAVPQMLQIKSRARNPRPMSEQGKTAKPESGTFSGLGFAVGPL
jgi:hypothetical protein